MTNGEKVGAKREAIVVIQSQWCTSAARTTEFNFYADYFAAGMNRAADRPSSLTFTASRSGHPLVNEAQEAATKTRAPASLEIGEPLPSASSSRHSHVSV